MAQIIWEDRNIKFLDPCTKSGVFLREITARLTSGLREKIPNLEERVDHILSKQVFGVSTTKLTSLLSRRSIYCSKNANSKNSIIKTLNSADGNIWFERIEHSWISDRCKFCGANRAVLERDANIENYAYGFIHNQNINEFLERIFGENMQFDVIIGNPPYQLQDTSKSASAKPIYHKFIEQAIKLEPKYLTMVTPSRWFSGGKGLQDFRAAQACRYQQLKSSCGLYCR